MWVYFYGVDQFSLVAPLFFCNKGTRKGSRKSMFPTDWVDLPERPSMDFDLNPWTQSVGSTLVLESICINRMAINFLCQCLNIVNPFNLHCTPINGILLIEELCLLTIPGDPRNIGLMERNYKANHKLSVIF